MRMFFFSSFYSRRVQPRMGPSGSLLHYILYVFMSLCTNLPAALIWYPLLCTAQCTGQSLLGIRCYILHRSVTAGYPLLYTAQVSHGRVSPVPTIGGPTNWQLYQLRYKGGQVVSMPTGPFIWCSYLIFV